MRLIAFAVAGFVAVTAGVASAQPIWGPEQGRFYGPERAPVWRERTGPIRPQQVSYIVQSMGLDPVGPPTQTGHLIVQRASDDFGRMLRVTLDLNNGRIVSVVPAHLPANGGPYEAYRPPYGPGPYARVMPDDDDEFGPPAAVLGPRGPVPPLPPGAAPPRAATAAPDDPLPGPPPLIEAPKPSTKSAKAHPQKTPVPRKRPAGAETATTKSEPGSVAPLPATAAPAAAEGATPAPAPAPGATPSAPPANTEMPPVTPLE